jgi:hypothetical protein
MKEFQAIRSSGQEISLKNHEISRLSEVALSRFACGARLFKALLYQFSSGKLKSDAINEDDLEPNE